MYRTEIDGEAHFVAVGIGSDERRARAREKAIHQAKTQLVSMLATRIEADSRSMIVQNFERGSGNVAQETRSYLHTSTSANLKQSSQWGKAVFAPLDQGVVQAYVRVKVPEWAFLPWMRLLKLTKNKATPAQSFFDLAKVYEIEGHLGLVELALRQGFDVDPSPEGALRCARFYRNHHQATEALLWVNRVLAMPAVKGPVRDQAEVLKKSLTSDLPTIHRVNQDLLELARQRVSGIFVGRLSKGTSAEYRLAIRLEKRVGYRFILSWIEDDSITAHWVPVGTMSGTRDNIDLDGPVDTAEARLVVWAVPRESSVWAVAKKIADQNFVAGKASRMDRLILKDFVQLLRSEDSLAFTTLLRRAER